MRRRRLLLSLGLMAVLTGCGSLSAPPKDRFYRLAVPAPLPAPPAGPRSHTVYVAPFTASGLHGERALVFAHPDGITLEQYGYHFWIDSPRILLQQALADRLAADYPLRVAREPVPDADYVVRGHIRRFEKGEKGVAVELTIALHAGRDRDVPVFQRTYTRSLETGDPSVEAAVAAIGEASAEVLSEFSADIRELLGQAGGA